jgi:PAS domain S-box-containing protein
MINRDYTLLIVEDDPIDLALYRRFLKTDSNFTYHLLETELVEEGLRLCSSNAIDAILLDYSLPNRDGLDFIRELHIQSNGNHSPIIMMTGMGDERIAVAAIKLGAYNYIVKRDLTPELLKSTIQSAMEQTQIKTTLQEKSQQITTIWESMTDAYVSIDRDWRIVYTNPAATLIVRQLVGLTPEEFLGKTHWEVFPWSVGNIVEQEYRRSLAEQVATNFEVLYEPNQAWFEIHVYPSIEGLGIYFRDITERKRNEEELRRSEEFNRRILESHQDCVKVLDLEGRLLYMNDNGQKLMEIDDFHTVERTHWLEFWQGNDAQTANTAFTTAKAGTSIKFEGHCTTRKSTPKWWEVVITPIFDANNNVHQILSVSRDVTERKRIERDLQISQAQLQSGIKVAGVGLARFDYNSNLVTLSPEAAILFGFSATELVVSREQIHATFHPDERAELEVIIDRVLEPNGTGWFARDHQVVWPDGRVRCLSVRKQVFFEHSDSVSRPSHAILAAIDVTALSS